MPNNIRKIAANPRPPPIVPISVNKMIGKSAVAGTEAMTCTSGCSQRASRASVPIATPTGTVQANAIARDPVTRSKVANKPTPISTHCVSGTCRSMAPAR